VFLIPEMRVAIYNDFMNDKTLRRGNIQERLLKTMTLHSCDSLHMFYELLFASLHTHRTQHVETLLLDTDALRQSYNRKAIVLCYAIFNGASPTQLCMLLLAGFDARMATNMHGDYPLVDHLLREYERHGRIHLWSIYMLLDSGAIPTVPLSHPFLRAHHQRYLDNAARLCAMCVALVGCGRRSCIGVDMVRMIARVVWQERRFMLLRECDME
jgi:hypothetical protein